MFLPRGVSRTREEVYIPMHLEVRKRDQPSVKAADNDGLGSRHIFITDKKTKISFLVDTNADISVYPRSKIHGHVNKNAYELFTANGTRIATYGTTAIYLNLSLRRAFKWNFVIADNQMPIIDVDFLSHYRLLVDPRNKRLLDTTTQLSSRGYAATTEEISIKTVIGKSVYHRLLVEFPDLTRPPAFGREKIRHGVVHHIETTPGPPVCSKPRRLAPDRLKQIKAEFAHLIEQRMMRPSKSLWASALHVVPKKDENLRPCGDHRALNARTVPPQVLPTACPRFFRISSVLTIKFRSRPKTIRMRFVDEITRGLDFVFAYIDDFWIATETEEQHREHLRILFKRLNDYGVVINSAKCEFGVNEITFLEHTVNTNGIKSLAERVDAIVEVPLPVIVKALRRYLGMTNFYRSFIPGAAKILQPLNDLLQGGKKGNTPIGWPEQSEASFRELKCALANATIS